MCVFPTGKLDFLQKPAVAFVRLSDSVVMESVLESSIPVRFIFLLVGPSDSGINYSESGRAMGALLADWVSKKLRSLIKIKDTSFVWFWVNKNLYLSLCQVFCLEAHLAQTSKEITDAIADFMDCSIVIPPTQIQDKAMLEPVIDFQKKLLTDRLRSTDPRLTFGERVKGQHTTKIRSSYLAFKKRNLQHLQQQNEPMRFGE